MTFDREYCPPPNEAELPLFACCEDRQCVNCEPEEATVQEAELKRVTGKIAELIEEFFDWHQPGCQFHADDLHQFVSKRVKVSPASADRVMRELRRVGRINYEVVNRRMSLYRKIV